MITQPHASYTSKCTHLLMWELNWFYNDMQKGNWQQCRTKYMVPGIQNPEIRSTYQFGNPPGWGFPTKILSNRIIHRSSVDPPWIPRWFDILRHYCRSLEARILQVIRLIRLDFARWQKKLLQPQTARNWQVLHTSDYAITLLFQFWNWKGEHCQKLPAARNPYVSKWRSPLHIMFQMQ